MSGVSGSHPSPTSVDALADLAERAAAEGREDEAIPKVRDGAARHHSALLWQWTGLLQRAADRHADALESFTNAARLDSANARIAHGRAHTALEAGVPAVALFDQALRLEPANGEILIGRAAALVAAGEADAAVAQLRVILAQQPLWLQGHVQLGQILATAGRPDEATGSIEQALASNPGAAPLWEAYLHVQVRRGALSTLRPILDRARSADARSANFALYEAIDAGENDPRDFPPALFEAAPRALDDALASWRVRHLLKVGKPEAALPILDPALESPAAADLWPYAATLWRLVGDPRSDWLEGDPRLIQVIDMGDRLGDREALANRLRALHTVSGQYLDQSVRGGSQTDGPLFSRIDPPIQALRAAVVAAVEGYRAALPARDPAHPLLGPPRDQPVRFSGSWSVRLRPGGRHSNHVHPQGWISSALYVSLPETQRDSHEGWLQLGVPDEQLGLTLAPRQMIEPRPGRLVLFPSWMWHGTIPFAEGERLTVAFDVAPPR